MGWFAGGNVGDELGELEGEDVGGSMGVELGRFTGNAEGKDEGMRVGNVGNGAGCAVGSLVNFECAHDNIGHMSSLCSSPFI